MNEEQLTLTTNAPTRVFRFQYSFSYIKIKRINIDSLFGQNIEAWNAVLQNLSIFFTSKTGYGSISSFPLYINGRISPYHRLPIIELEDFIVPKENKGKMTSTRDFVNELTIEIRNNNLPLPQVQMTIFYEKTPGVINE